MGMVTGPVGGAAACFQKGRPPPPQWMEAGRGTAAAGEAAGGAVRHLLGASARQQR